METTINRNRLCTLYCERPHAGRDPRTPPIIAELLPGSRGMFQCQECGAWYYCEVVIEAEGKPFRIRKTSVDRKADGR
jgi:hypothetical protein